MESAVDRRKYCAARNVIELQLTLCNVYKKKEKNIQISKYSTSCLVVCKLKQALISKIAE